MGLGHITRCLAIAQALKSKGASPYFIVNGDRNVRNELRGERFVIRDWVRSGYEFNKETAVAIIDSYYAGPGFYKIVSKSAKVPIYLDDYKRLRYPDGSVVNGTINADDLNYPSRKGVKYLFGTSYLPLRKEFWKVPAKRIRKKLGCVMITFGGNDVKNMTPRVLRMLSSSYPELKKKVLVGEGCSCIGQIEKIKDKSTEIIYFADAGKMRDVMLEADLAISASGQTLYELARIGVPTVAIGVSDNQLNNIKGFRQIGFIRYAGWYKDKNLSSNLIECIDSLSSYKNRRSCSREGRLSVDGAGAQRIANICVKKAS